MAEVTLAGLHKKYGDNVAIPSLDLTIEEGEFVTLLGPSGCGKTTTLRCVAGLERPTGGTVSIGSRLVDAPAQGIHVPPEKRDLGMVFQSYALWPHMTVFDNVAYPLKMRRTKAAERRTKVGEALELVGLGQFATRPASKLSGGQQQRVSLARALVAQPRLLLFDEPLSNLDARLRQEMRTELRSLHQRLGTTSIFVTHDQDEAVSLSTRVIVMRAGIIQQSGSAREVYWHPENRFVADFVGYDNFLEATIAEIRDDVTFVRIAGADGPIAVPHRSEHTSGQEVVVALRSTSVLAGSAIAAHDSNLVAGRIVGQAYLGDDYELAFQVGDQILRLRIRVAESVHLWPRGIPEIGEELTVSLPQNSMACFVSSAPHYK